MPPFSGYRSKHGSDAGCFCIVASLNLIHRGLARQAALAFCHICTGSGFLWESFSSDTGCTWSEGRPSAIKNPGSGFFIRRLASGDLLLVNHDRCTGRSYLTAWISTDDGRTWNDGLLLHERSGVSYPDGVQGRNGLIRISCDRDRYGAGEIFLAAFREEDAASGRNVFGAVILKRIVNGLERPAS